MSNQFFEISKTVANDFLQNIVFIDDEAYGNNEDKDHDLDAHSVSKVFGKSRKICSIYNPKNEEDIQDLISISQKADIVILDWKIDIKKTPITKNEEEIDEENDDPRGRYTLEIIKGVLSENLGLNELKMFVIYTGETNLWQITEDIFNQLSKEVEGLKREDFEVYTKNLKVVVIGKQSLRAKHIAEIEARIKTYNELPDFILDEFTKMTSGLLSNFVLQSLSVLRKNTFRLINLYNKELDSAFLTHRFLLPNQEDSKEQLIEYLSDTIQNILNYNHVGESVSIENIGAWIDTKTFNELKNISGKDIILNNVFIKTWAKRGFIEACQNAWVSLGHGDAQGKQIENFQKKFDNIYQEGSSFWLGGGENECDSLFSILTHHKSNLKQPSTIPKLSLGTIIKQNQTEKYYLCIQAKCDSVRLSEDARKFLFLPLVIVVGNKKFHFVVEENGTFKRLKITKEAFELRTIKFIPIHGSSIIIAKEDSGNFIFESSFKEKYVWLSDLKDAHAQRVANNFASQLSRVGLDESEWLRRWSY